MDEGADLSELPLGSALGLSPVSSGSSISYRLSISQGLGEECTLRAGSCRKDAISRCRDGAERSTYVLEANVIELVRSNREAANASRVAVLAGIKSQSFRESWRVRRWFRARAVEVR